MKGPYDGLLPVYFEPHSGIRRGESASRVRRAVTYRGTSLIRNNALLGPYSRTMPRALWWS